MDKLELQNYLNTIQNFLNKQIGKELIYNGNNIPYNTVFGRRPVHSYTNATILDGFVFYNRRKGNIIIWVLYKGSYASHMFNHILKTYLNCSDACYFNSDNKNELEQYEKINKFNGPHRQHSQNWFKKKY